MDHGYSIEFRDDHVHIQLSPGYEFQPDDSTSIWAEIKRLCDEHETCRVLVEGHLPEGERSTPEIIAAGQRTATVPHLWLAFHADNHVPSERSELFEAIAGSKGVRVKHFADRERALMWLRHNSPS
ncbi:MAG: hypothetical protein JO314_03475 [Acidobacteria bacterium]|nr:hypothetical protein [Acidobacteriota bacterium]